MPPEKPPRVIANIPVGELRAAGFTRIIPAQEVQDRFGYDPTKPDTNPPQTPTPEFSTIKEREYKKLGLERVELHAEAAAQALMARVFDTTNPQRIDITTAAGKQLFIESWHRTCGTLPPPCVLKDSKGVILPNQTSVALADWEKSDFWYLTQLSTGKINKTIDIANPVPAHPDFTSSGPLFMESWPDGDYDNQQFQQTKSPLLKALGVNADGSVVNIKREDLDAALWEGDPSNRTKTQKHIDLIKQLGLDPTNYQFRCIRQDEYARISQHPTHNYNFGKHNLWTNFDHYFFEDDDARGLLGGHRGRGGASDVDSIWRSDPLGNLAVRLVLECNK